MNVDCNVKSCNNNDGEGGCNTDAQVTLQEDDYHWLFSCDSMDFEKDEDIE
jgi:hypothetical protein